MAIFDIMRQKIVTVNEDMLEHTVGNNLEYIVGRYTFIQGKADCVLWKKHVRARISKCKAGESTKTS